MQMPGAHIQRSAAARAAGLLALAAVAVWALRNGALGELAGIVFGGAVLAFLLSPLARLLERRFSPGVAAGLSLAIAAAALLALAALALPALIRQLTTLFELLPAALDRLQGLLAALAERLRRSAPGLTLPEPNLAAADGALGAAARGAAAWLGGLSGGAYRFALMAALSCFFLADRERALLRLELAAPQRWRWMAVRAGKMLLRELRLYVRGQITIALAVGALASLGFLLIGLPGAPLLGMVVGMLNVIPYLGPFLGGVPAVASALSIGWERALMALAILLAVQQIDGMVISPRVMGSVTGFSPAVVLLALFAGANLCGVAGLLFAIPALMAARCAYRVYVQRNDASSAQISASPEAPAGNAFQNSQYFYSNGKND